MTRLWAACGLLVCLGGAAERAPTRVRVAYAIPQLGRVDLTLAGDGPELVWEGLPAPAASDYRTTGPGQARFVVKVTGAATDEPLLETPVAIPGPGNWTVVALQRLGDRRVCVLRDDPPEIEPGRAVVRVAAAVPDADPLRAVVRRLEGRTVERLHLGVVAYGEAGPYRLTTAGPIALELYRTDDDAPFFEAPSLRLLPGFAYTLLAAGYELPEDELDLGLTILPLLDTIPTEAGP